MIKNVVQPFVHSLHGKKNKNHKNTVVQLGVELYALKLGNDSSALPG